MGPSCRTQSSRDHYNSGLRLCNAPGNSYAFHLQVRCSDVDVFGRQPGFFPGKNAWFTHDWNTVGYRYTLTIGDVLARSVNEVVFVATRYVADGGGTVEEVGILRVPSYLSPDSCGGFVHADPLEPDIQPGDLSRWGVVGPLLMEGQIRALFPVDHPSAIGYILDHFDPSKSFIPRYLVSPGLNHPTYSTHYNPSDITGESLPPIPHCP